MAHDPIHITLSDEAAIEFVRGKVRSGEYASADAVIEEGLAVLRQEAEDRELWEREVLIPAHDRVMADPSSAVPVEEVQRHLEARRVERLNAS